VNGLPPVPDRLAVQAAMVDIRVVSVTRHAPDHLEVGMAGGEGYWPDEDRDSDGPYTNLTASFRIFSNTNRPTWREWQDDNERTLREWQAEDTPLLVLDLQQPTDAILILDEPGRRFVSFAAPRRSQ
jgi:hypothetical protein